MIRKLFASLVLTTLLLPAASRAQVPGVSKITRRVVPTITLGVKAGLNMQSLDGNTWDQTYKPGFLGGPFISVDAKKTGIRVEGLVKTARFDLYNSNKQAVNCVYFDLPALFEIKIVRRVWLQLGPQVSMLVKARHTQGVDYKNNFTAADFAAVGGVEVKLPRRLTAGLRYVKGLVNVNNTVPSANWKASSFQLSVGYRFLN